MTRPDKKPVTLEELVISSLPQGNALAKLLTETGLITREEFMEKISEERSTYQKILNPTKHRFSIDQVLTWLEDNYPHT